MKMFLLMCCFAVGTMAQSVTAPSLIAVANDKVDVSITADGLMDIIACQATIFYDDDAIQATGNQASNWGCSAGDLINNSTVLCNGSEPGVFRIIVYGANNFSGSGTIVTIPFRTFKGDSDLDMEEVGFYTGQGPVKMAVEDGSITLQ